MTIVEFESFRRIMKQEDYKKGCILFSETCDVENLSDSGVVNEKRPQCTHSVDDVIFTTRHTSTSELSIS